MSCEKTCSYSELIPVLFLDSFLRRSLFESFPVFLVIFSKYSLCFSLINLLIWFRTKHFGTPSAGLGLIWVVDISCIAHSPTFPFPAIREYLGAQYWVNTYVSANILIFGWHFQTNFDVTVGFVNALSAVKLSVKILILSWCRGLKLMSLAYCWIA